MFAKGQPRPSAISRQEQQAKGAASGKRGLIAGTHAENTRAPVQPVVGRQLQAPVERSPPVVYQAPPEPAIKLVETEQEQQKSTISQPAQQTTSAFSNLPSTRARAPAGFSSPEPQAPPSPSVQTEVSEFVAIQEEPETEDIAQLSVISSMSSSYNMSHQTDQLCNINISRSASIQQLHAARE